MPFTDILQRRQPNTVQEGREAACTLEIWLILWSIFFVRVTNKYKQVVKEISNMKK